jgi:hypothetical protein
MFSATYRAIYDSKPERTAIVAGDALGYGDARETAGTSDRGQPVSDRR